MARSLPLDRLGRPLGVLRLSLTARCNLACPYCLPDGQEPAGLLSLEQRLRLIRAAVALGVRSLRLTGGEPLLHEGLEAVIRGAASLRHPTPPQLQEPGQAGGQTASAASSGGQSPLPPGLHEIALTTNGILLSASRAHALRHAGLDRLTLSLDGSDGASVARMAGLADAASGERALERVLAAIDHAIAAGFDPARGQLKLNAVIQRGRNDDQLLPLASLARERGLELRLIEFMDVGNRNGWHPEAVLSAGAMLEQIARQWPLQPLGRADHATAGRWRYRDGAGQLAVVASVSAPFCGDCNRLRITADGIAYTCLFASPERGLDLRPWLDPERSEGELQQAIAALWAAREDRWSEERLSAWQESGAGRPNAHAEMAYLGG